MTEVANLVKCRGLPKMQAIILYNVLAISKALLVAQIRMPSKKFLKLCNTLAVSILGGPGSWVPHDLPFVLKRFFGFPVEIGHMEAFCFASRIRTSICTIPHWRDSWKSLEDSKRFGNSNVRHPMNNWIENSGSFVMMESCKHFIIEDFAIFCLKEGIADCPISEIPRIQNRICSFTGNRFIDFNMKSTFSYRFKLRARFDDHELNDLALRAVSFCEDIVSHVPPCVLFAVINTMFNGWTTEARFQKSESKCVLCRDCLGEDSLDHYASCNIVWSLFSSIFREPLWPCSIDRFLGLRCDSLKLKIRHACFLYAIRYSTNHFRRSGTSSPSVEESKKVIKSGIKTACLHHSGLAVALFGSSAILDNN